MKTLAATLKQLPKARQRKITARAKQLIAEERPRLEHSPLSAPIKALTAKGRLAQIVAEEQADARRQAQQDPHAYAVVLVGYRVTLEPDRDGTIEVHCPGFPGVQTWGDNEADALERAADALASVIDAYIGDKRAMPPPSWVRTLRDDADLKVVGAGTKVMTQRRRLFKRLANLGGQYPIVKAPRRRRPKE